MKRSPKVKGLLEAFLIIGLILVIPLFFAIKSRANSQNTTATTAPAVPTANGVLESTAAAKAKEPAPCTFPLAQITATEPTPEEYTFSEPQVVLTAAKGNIYNIAEWLPNNQQVLMTEELRNAEVGNDKPIQESISLYNSVTGESKVIAFRELTYETPSWLPDLNAVVYPAITHTNIDRKAGTYKSARQIWVSYGNPDTVQILADNLPQILLATKPGGSETIYLSDKKISKLDKSLKKLPSASFDPAQWDYGKGRRDKNPVSYKMAWQPGTSRIFLYSGAGGSANGGYTFILDTNTGQICELNMGGWAEKAHWSPDGRYLAITRSTVYVGFTNSIDLAILDTITGKLFTLGVLPQDAGDQHSVDDFTWTPDNRHLLALGHIPVRNINQQPKIIQELYLVDFISSQNIQLFPEFQSFSTSGVSGNSFGWSPNGLKLLVHCPTNSADQLCLISVRRTGQ